MAENANRRHLPFDEFINFNLDMAGVDGISFETVALVMREYIREQAADGDLQIDRLQATLHECLSIEIISHLLQRDSAVATIDPHLIDNIVSLTMLLAFGGYNHAAERFGFESPSLARSQADVQRLWSLLRTTAGWVEKAAGEGDAVAAATAREIRAVMEQVAPPNWSNNTRTLPG